MRKGKTEGRQPINYNLSGNKKIGWGYWLSFTIDN